MKTDDNNGSSYANKNWALKMKSMLHELGLANIWINQDNFNINLQPINLRILDIYKQTWFSDINNSSRLSSYCLYKQEVEIEFYQKQICTNKFRHALTKFRLSVHKLAIETGRHNGIDRHLRKCQNCSLNKIEYEYHFLLECPKYCILRNRFLKPYYCRRPTTFKFIQIMS